MLYWIDVNIVDGIINALGALVRGISKLLSPLETGQAQCYAGIFACGAIALAVYGYFYAGKIVAMLGGAF